MDVLSKWHLTWENVDMAKETQSLLIATQNNTIRTNHIKARIDKTQQNCRCMLCDDRDKMINHIISECSKLAQKEYKTRCNWVGKVIHWGIVQEVEVWPYKQMVYAQKRICPGEWDTQTPLGFWHTNRSPNLGQTTRPYNNQQKVRTCRIMDFAVPADHWVKLKECEKRDKNLNLARELKKQRNMKVMIIPIVIGALGTVTKGLVQGLEDLKITGGMETIQTTALLRLARIWKRVLETWGDLLSLKLQWKNYQLTLIWKLLRSKIIIIYHNKTLTVIVRGLCMIKKGTNKHINKIPSISSQYKVQKIPLWGTAHFHKSIVSMWLKNIKGGSKNIDT